MKIRLTMRYLAIIFLCGVVWPIANFSADGDKEAIEKLIIDAYVQAVYVNRDEKAVRKGFHPDFVMHVNRDGLVVKESLNGWMERLKLDGIKTTAKVDYSVEFIDIAGNFAVARLEIYQDSRHLYTDYFGFYKFGGDWLFINKIFFTH